MRFAATERRWEWDWDSSSSSDALSLSSLCRGAFLSSLHCLVLLACVVATFHIPRGGRSAPSCDLVAQYARTCLALGRAPPPPHAQVYSSSSSERVNLEHGRGARYLIIPSQGHHVRGRAEHAFILHVRHTLGAQQTILFPQSLTLLAFATACTGSDPLRRDPPPRPDPETPRGRGGGGGGQLEPPAECQPASGHQPTGGWPSTAIGKMPTSVG